MSNNYTEIDSKISNFIYEKPELVVEVLKKYNYKLPYKVTLQDITSNTFKAIYMDENKQFIDEFSNLIANDGYNNVLPVVALAVTAAISIASSIMGANQAKKALELQKKIALANLSQQKLIEQERIRVGAETERTRILLNSLQQYQSDLQKQSTQRLKDVWIYVGVLGASAGIVIGVYMLLTTKE